MADTWYVRTDAQGVVTKVFCDDMVKPQAGDIQLDINWYWGRAPGIRISDMIHGNRFTVANGRLVPRYDASSELEQAKQKKRAEVEDKHLSPILSTKKKNDLPKAKKEVEDHLDGCINTEEVSHTLLIGY